MKKFLSKILGILSVLSVCAFCSACSSGGVVDTSLILAEDLSGTRIMHITLDSAAVKQYSSRSVEEIDELVKENCPEVLKYSFLKDSNGENVMTFELAFDSYEDYSAKAASLYEGAVIDIYFGNTVWNSGISVSESFTSRDLLSWLPQMLVDKGIVSADNSSYILGAGKTTLTFGKNAVDTYEKISYDNSSHVKVDSIYLFTEINRDNTFNRTVRFRVDESTVGNKEKEIKTYFEKKLVSKAKVSVEESAGLKIFVVKAEKISAAQIAEINELLFTGGSLTQKENEIGFFGIGKEFSEKMSCYDFMAWDNQTINIKSFLKYPEDMQVTNSEGALFSESTEYDGYRQIGFGNVGGDAAVTFEYTIVKTVPIKEVDITTLHKKNNIFARKIIFVLGEKISNEELDRIVGKITSEIEKKAVFSDEQFAPKISCNPNGSNATITVSAVGDRDDLNEITMVLTERDANITYAERFKFFLPAYDEAMYETFDFSECIRGVTDDFKIVYSMDLGSLSRMKECSAGNNEDVLVKNHTAIVTKYKNEKIEVVSTGYRMNMFVIFSIVLFIAAVTCIIISLVKTFLPDKSVKEQEIIASGEVVNNSEEAEEKASDFEQNI